jgi:hypothetical protein
MSDPQMPSSAPPTPPPASKVHMLDKPGSKIFFSFISFIAPVPLAIVITDFWLRFQGEIPENAINPMYFIKQAISGGGFGSIWPLLLALVPPVLILLILFRDVKSRLIMLALLMVAALLEFTGIASLSPI